METNNNLIFLADDIEENLLLLTRILSSAGYQVASTTKSDKVFSFCKENQPSLVLLDINMPGKDGFELCRQIKSDPSTLSIPVIFVSSLESTNDRLRGFESGAVDYITKPIEVEETLARVHSQVSIYNLQKKLELVNRQLDKRLEELTLSQDEIKERELKMLAFIKALPNETFVYDEMGNYLEIYSHEDHNLLASVDEMLGKNITDFLPPIVSKLKMDAIRSVLSTGQTKVIEYELRYKDGKHLWFEGRIALISKDEKDKGKVICVTTEITERIELYKKVEAQAIQDPLTNCFNRRHFISLAEKETSRANRYSRPLSMMVMDIDHFKNVNDTYGHPAGDEVLKQLVDICQKVLRPADVMGRYGGEEFCILFPETSIDGALYAAERIRQLIENTLFHSKIADIKITISAGVANLQTIDNKNTTLGDVFVAADKALYIAKSEGRNRIHSNGQEHAVGSKKIDRRENTSVPVLTQ